VGLSRAFGGRRGAPAGVQSQHRLDFANGGCNLRTLFSIGAGLTILLGVVWLFFPQAMLSSWGVQGDEVAVYMARRYGCLFFGYAAILWLARAAASSPARTAILAHRAVAMGPRRCGAAGGVRFAAHPECRTDVAKERRTNG
jgi:hypothetical protein